MFNANDRVLSVMKRADSQYQVRTHEYRRSGPRIGGVLQSERLRNVLRSLVWEQCILLPYVGDGSGIFSQ